MAEAKQRWAFLKRELTAPEACNANDEFIACVQNVETGVIVFRNGEVSNHYGDGIAGVDQKSRDEAEAEDELYNPKTTEPTGCWREVIADAATGAFIRFA